MKIVHIAPNSPYNEGWGYQENLLPKYQAKLGNEVWLVVPNLTHKDGKIIVTPCDEYLSPYGFKVIRLQYQRYLFGTRFFSKMRVFPLLCEIKPDLVFFHGLISRTIFDVIKFKRLMNPECVILQDNHLDYNIGWNTGKNASIKLRLIQRYHRALNRKTIKFISKVYGVTPWRRQYAEDYFQIPSEKTDVLIMGADDDSMDFLNRSVIRREIRDRYHVKENDFLIVTGGKLDSKKNVLNLMRACSKIDGVILLIFGELSDEIRDEFYNILANCNQMRYIGWVNANKVYDYFFAADLVCFPGQHSVLWEQACASKTPCLFKKWTGMQHVNNGGNSAFIDGESADEIREAISSCMEPNAYINMKEIASSPLTNIYKYSEIAKKTIIDASTK